MPMTGISSSRRVEATSLPMAPGGGTSSSCLTARIQRSTSRRIRRRSHAPRVKTVRRCLAHMIRQSTRPTKRLKSVTMTPRSHSSASPCQTFLSRLMLWAMPVQPDGMQALPASNLVIPFSAKASKGLAADGRLRGHHITANTRRGSFSTVMPRHWTTMGCWA